MKVKNFSIFIVFTLLLAFFTSCSNSITEKPSETGAIVGKVIYDNENVNDFSGIQVTLCSTNGLQTTDFCYSRGIATTARAVTNQCFTDSKGNYSFTNVAEGVYTIYASSNSSTKKAVTTNVVVKSSSTVTVEDLGLTATGSIKGKITSTTPNSDLLGYDVFIAGTSYIAKVGSDGFYEITNIPAKKGYILCLQKGTYTKKINDNLEVKAHTCTTEGTSTEITEENIHNDTFKWLGSFATAPSNPNLYEAYFNTSDGCSYIWNGTNWDLLAMGQEVTEEPKHAFTCTPTEKGIKFTGALLSNIQEQTTECTITVTDVQNNVSMEREYTLGNPWNVWESWEMVYPLVEKGKEYSFEVTTRCGSSIINSENFKVIAIGGFGEYIVENADTYKVTLSEDKTTLSRTPQIFTNNPNVPVIDYGTYYSVYSNSDTDTSIYNGVWIPQKICWDKTTKQMYLLDSSNFEVLEGRRLGVGTTTKVKIAGFTYNDSTLFSLNDYKEVFFNWDNNAPRKFFIIYSYIDEEKGINENYQDVPGVSPYYVSYKYGYDEKAEENYLIDFDVFEEPGEGRTLVYGKIINYGDIITEPIYIPKTEVKDHIFTGQWEAQIERMEGYFYSQKITISFPLYSKDFGVPEDIIPITFMPVYKPTKYYIHFLDNFGNEIFDTVETTNESFRVNFEPPFKSENYTTPFYWVYYSYNDGYNDQRVWPGNAINLTEYHTYLYAEYELNRIEFIYLNEDGSIYNTQRTWDFTTTVDCIYFNNGFGFSLSECIPKENYILEYWRCNETGNRYGINEQIYILNTITDKFYFTPVYRKAETCTVTFYNSKTDTSVVNFISVIESQSSDGSIYWSFTLPELPEGALYWSDGYTIYNGNYNYNSHNLPTSFYAVYE